MIYSYTYAPFGHIVYMDNVFIDEIDFTTDVVPRMEDFKALEDKVKEIFNKTKMTDITIPLQDHVIKDSRIGEIKKLANFIETSIHGDGSLLTGYIDSKAFKERNRVESVSYRFISILHKGGKELTVLKIVPKYSEGFDLWNSIKKVFQKKSK